MTETEESFIVYWFPPEGDRERSYTSEASARRRIATDEEVARWNPILLHRVRKITTTETILEVTP